MCSLKAGTNLSVSNLLKTITTRCISGVTSATPVEMTTKFGRTTEPLVTPWKIPRKPFNNYTKFFNCRLNRCLTRLPLCKVMRAKIHSKYLVLLRGNLMILLWRIHHTVNQMDPFLLIKLRRMYNHSFRLNFLDSLKMLKIRSKSKTIVTLTLRWVRFQSLLNLSIRN